MRLAGRRVPLAPKSGPVRGRGAACEPLKTPTPTEITHGVRNTTPSSTDSLWPAETAAALGHHDLRARNLR
jgi:hypothetical protein